MKYLKKIVLSVALIFFAMVTFFMNTDEPATGDINLMEVAAISVANADCPNGVDCSPSMSTCVIVNGNTYYGYPYWGCV